MDPSNDERRGDAVFVIDVVPGPTLTTTEILIYIIADAYRAMQSGDFMWVVRLE